MPKHFTFKILSIYHSTRALQQGLVVKDGNDAKRPQGHMPTKIIFPFIQLRDGEHQSGAPEFLEKALYVILVAIYGL